jgi:hypothetical protein
VGWLPMAGKRSWTAHLPRDMGKGVGGGICWLLMAWNRYLDRSSPLKCGERGWGTLAADGLDKFSPPSPLDEEGSGESLANGKGGNRAPK